jgi:DTW domain-containing protein YfiP
MSHTPVDLGAADKLFGVLQFDDTSEPELNMVSFQALSPDVSGLLTFEEVGITYKAIKLLWRRHASESVCCWQTTFEEVCASGGMKGKQLGAAAVASLVALDHIHLDHERNLITPGAKWGTTSPRAASKETLPKSTGGAAAPAASDSASMSATSLFPSLGAETAFEFNAARVVLAKDTSAHERKNKCERCWKTVNGASLCLCTKVQQLMASPEGDLWRNSGQPRWRFLVYMSREEWRCGGNSGRLLLNLFPAETSFYVHGVRRDAERLRAALFDDDGKACPACVLFPGSDALTVPQWLASTSPPWGGNSRGSLDEAYHPSGSTDGSCYSSSVSANTSTSISSSSNADIDGSSSSSASSSSSGSGYKTVVLVDGTWRQARRMAKHLASVLLPEVPQVTLTLEGPNRLSVFRRKQSAEGRVCTSEALSLFLGEAIVASSTSTCAQAAAAAAAAVENVAAAEASTAALSSTLPSSTATVEACYTMVQRAVQLNNSALDPTRTVLWVGTGLTPDW